MYKFSWNRSSLRIVGYETHFPLGSLNGVTFSGARDVVGGGLCDVVGRLGGLDVKEGTKTSNCSVKFLTMHSSL